MSTNFKSIILVVVVYTCILAFFSILNIADFVSNQLQAPLDFKMREYVGRSPKLSPDLKIIAFDDATMDRLKLPELSVLAWAKLIKSLSERNPRQIFIDKQFRVLRRGRGLQEIEKSLEDYPHVKVGASARKMDKNNYFSMNTLIDGSKRQYRLSQYTNSKKLPSWVSEHEYLGYGPAERLTKLFANVGHINYDYIGRIQPFFRIGESSVLPHLALFASSNISIEGEKLKLSDKEVGLDRMGLIPVNFLSLEVMQQNTKSLLPYYVRSFKSLPLQSIDSGDTVIILPLFYTGNVDIGMTPIGRVPRGYVIVSLINSVLSGKWIHPFSHLEFTLFCAVSAGSVLGFFLSPLWFFSSLIALLFSIAFSSFVLFSWFSIQTPWLVWVIAAIVAAILSFAMKTVRQHQVSKAYELALTGLVSRSEIKAIVKNPSMLLRMASEKHLSVMFIDMVGFSKLAELEQPKVIFNRLKKSLRLFTQIVHRYSGVVDKSLGDGMLCFFGYNIVTGEASQFHADQAIRCALAIQREYVYSSLEQNINEPVIPLRIGINSANVLIGDLGDENRIDFTLIGDGVNFAQRLESACEPFSVLVSEETLFLSRAFCQNSSIVQARRVRIKHHDDLIDVYELSPFLDSPEVLEQARQLFYQTEGRIYRAPRWPVSDKCGVWATVESGSGPILNFSRTGYALRLAVKPEIGSSCPLKFFGRNERYHQEIYASNFPKIICEIRWVCNDMGGHFICGCRILNLTQKEADNVYERLKRFITVEDHE